VWHTTHQQTAGPSIQNYLHPGTRGTFLNFIKENKESPDKNAVLITIIVTITVFLLQIYKKNIPCCEHRWGSGSDHSICS
jgi:hypothetical protein